MSEVTTTLTFILCPMTLKKLQEGYPTQGNNQQLQLERLLQLLSKPLKKLYSYRRPTASYGNGKGHQKYLKKDLELPYC